jgi:hypothetical protein
MHCLIKAGKHVSNIRAIARQPPIEIIDGLLEAVFSVVSFRSYIARTPCRLSALQLSEVKSLVCWSVSSVDGWWLSRALQGRLRRDGVIVELTADKSSFEGYSPVSNDVRAGR